MRPLDFNLRHLRAMIATAESGSLSAAARMVNLTQSAITQGIAKLERQAGLSLFDRRSDGVAPTDAAQILVPRARVALGLIGSHRVTAPQVRAFLTVARHGSYAAAAAETGMREPSLHRSIADLSINLGQQLVERRGRGISLTSRGLAVARRFRLAEAELAAAIAEIEMLKGREVGRIAIGAMPLSRARLLPNVIATFHRLYPDVDIAIVEGSHPELVGPLRNGDVDLMLGALREVTGDDLAQRPLFVDCPMILGRAGHPLLDAPSLSAERLAAFPWILPPEGTPLRTHWAAMFEGSGITAPRVAIESGSVMVARQLLADGDFLTLLSPDQVAVELEAGWLARIGPPLGGFSRVIGITTRSDWRPTRIQQHFLQLIEEESRRIEAGRISIG